MSCREQVLKDRPGRCSFCWRLATTVAWGVLGYGPGGGIDAIWGKVPACERCANSGWGDRGVQFPHTLPEGAGSTREC